MAAIVWAEQFRAIAGVILPLKKNDPFVTFWLYWLFGLLNWMKTGVQSEG